MGYGITWRSSVQSFKNSTSSNVESVVRNSCKLLTNTRLSLRRFKKKQLALPRKFLSTKLQSLILCKYIYIYIYIFTSYTTIVKLTIKCYKLVVRGNIFRPHCGHLQASLYKSSAFNVRTVWDPIVCTIILYVE